MAVSLALAVLLQGCASPGRSVTQTVSVETPGCERASCELLNDRGRWMVAATPGSVDVRTSDAPLRVSCRGEGGAVSSVDAAASAPATSAAAPLVGGAAGGAAVGVGNGAAGLAFIPVLGVLAVMTGVGTGALAGQMAASSARQLSYPERLVLPMRCGAAAQALAPGMPLGLAVRGLSPDEAQGAGLPQRGGVLVLGVGEGSRAAAAGLRAGDILLALAGQALQDPADLETRLAAAAPGAAVVLRLWREGRALELTLARAEGGP